MHFLGVPVQALARELAGDHTKTQGLGQRSGVVEAGQGLVLALDSVEELCVVVDVLESLFVNAIQNGVGIEGGHGTMGQHHPACFAHVERALLGQLVAVGQFQVRVAVMTGSAGAVPPSKSEIVGGVLGGREAVVHLVLLGMAKAIGCSAFGFDPEWIGKIERPEGCVKNMNAHVAQCTATEVENLPPLAGVINFLGKIPLGRGAEPEVPVERLGDGGFLSVRLAVIAQFLNDHT